MSQHVHNNINHHHYRKRQPMNLQDFLINHHTFSNFQICNHLCEFSQDREGSELIQRILEEASNHRKNEMFQEIKSNQIHS